MIARRLAVLVALASPPELSAFSRIYGIWPGEDHLQDFWGPARLGFEGSFAYEASVLAASDDDVASIIGGILGAGRARVVVGPMRHGEASYAAFLEAGGAFFPIAEGVDLAAYGLTNETSFQFVFSPDPINAAGLVAQEICRTTGYGAIHRVMRLYGAAYADSRVDANLAWLEEHCGATIFEHSSLRAYFREETAYDLAFSALVKDSGKIVADGDQYMSTPGVGAWRSMKHVIDVVRSNGYGTTADLQRFFDDGAAQIWTETSCQYADTEGYVLSYLLNNYAPSVRAKPASGVGPTIVRVGASDIHVDAVDTAGGSFSATAWINLEWHDARLAFDANIYNGTVLPAAVMPDGTVRARFKAAGEYVCDMNIAPYPYDDHALTRDPRYVVLTYVLVGWALNMLGFLVFWIPTEGSGIDRSGLAMTTILTAQFMMYEAKVTQRARRNRMVLALGGDGDYLDKVYRRQYELGEGSGGHFKNVVFFLFNLLFGGRDAFPVDRWARRYFVPFFFVSQIALCFYPFRKSGNITKSDYTGFNSPLCHINLAFAGMYAVVFALGLLYRSWDDKPGGFSAGWHETRREPITPKPGSVVLVGEATEAPEATGSRPRNRRLSSATTSTSTMSVRAWE
ncbi:GABA-A receptor [Aureococcus anophagefferens]|nr:GABA-A receptor [Aureococcus anophagefferens]